MQITAENLGMAAIIFILQMHAILLDTFRIKFITHGQKKRALVTGFFELVLIVLVLGQVLSRLDDILNVIGYAGGNATGATIGIWLEEKLALGHIHLRIISSSNGHAITSSLRNNGFAITEAMGRGKHGVVTVLHCGLNRQDVPLVRQLVMQIDESAFIVANEVKSIQHGFWHISKRNGFPRPRHNR